MIRQAISCDICGRDKQQTNHWFVVYEHGAELRVSGWSSQARMSAKAKHLCGQTCLHKLVDEYMARTVASRVASQADENLASDEKLTCFAMRSDASYTSAVAHTAAVRLTAAPVPVPLDEFESSARLVKPAEVAEARASAKPAALAPSVVDADMEFESSARLIEPSGPSVKETLQPAAAARQKIEEKLEPTVRVIVPILELHDEKVIPSRPGYNPRSWRTDAWKREQEREKRTRTGSRRRSLV
ncbi:MAG TPA: hypothetical protein VK720_09130 [Terracidiphilus sp.]|nr:hypothetical protein [Terracidiphilus sp.]